MDDLALLILSLNGMEGASALALAAIIAQSLKWLAARVFKEKFNGLWKLGFIYGTTFVLGVVFCHLAGVDWKGAIIHSNTVAQMQIFGHQVYKQTKEKLNG